MTSDNGIISTKIAEERERLIVRDNAPHLRESVQAKIDLLMDAVNKVKDVTRLDDVTRNKMAGLKQEARNLELEIHAQDKGTGVLDSLKRDVQNIQGTLEAHENVLKERKNKEETEASLAQLRQDYERSLEKLRERRNRNIFVKIFDVFVEVVDGLLSRVLKIK